MKVGIIGTGISGLSAAWLLHKDHDITVFEQNSYVGGHSNTVEASPYPAVDTGFIVYNERTYPNLIALFDLLDVETESTDMSFAVSLDRGRIEYSSDAFFVQKKNLFSLRYYRMLFDIVRFYRNAPKLLKTNIDESISLYDYLKENRYSDAFIRDHILPMAAAIWSMAIESSGSFPAKSFIRFFANHGLLQLQVHKRPRWFTVKGGSKNYVEKLTASFKDKIQLDCEIINIKTERDGVTVTDQDGNNHHFDHLIVATHTDQALKMLGPDTDKDYQTVLGGIPYSTNTAYLHTDERLMPRKRKAWASWCYMANTNAAQVSVSYWMNRLQPSIPQDRDIFVSLNPKVEPREENTVKKIEYDHPIFTQSAVDAWQNIKTIQGRDNIWFCGAWCGYGFHEDGISSGLSVAEQIDPGAKRPWNVKDMSPAGEHARAT